MKKTLLFALTLLAAYSPIRAQLLQDPGFENWAVTDTLWTGELLYGSPQWPGALQTTDSYTGTYAAMVQPYASCGITNGYMIYGAVDYMHFNVWQMEPDFTGSGAPISFKPASVNGRFKFLSPDSNDVAKGIVILTKYNAATHQSQIVGRGELTFAPTTDYTPFEIVVNDLQPGVMHDSILVAFTSGMGYSWNFENNVTSLGTLYIDDAALGKAILTPALAFPEIEQPFMSFRFFPNPTTEQLHYSFETTIEDSYLLIITDATGKKVFSERTKPGETHTIDTQSFATGTYYARIQGKRAMYRSETIVVNRL